MSLYILYMLLQYMQLCLQGPMYCPWIRSTFQRQLSSVHRFRFACFLLRLLQSCLPDFHSLLEQQLHFSVVLYLSTFVPVNQLKMLTFKMSALPYAYFSVRVLPLYMLKFDIQPSRMQQLCEIFPVLGDMVSLFSVFVQFWFSALKKGNYLEELPIIQNLANHIP